MSHPLAQMKILLMSIVQRSCVLYQGRTPSTHDMRQSPIKLIFRLQLKSKWKIKPALLKSCTAQGTSNKYYELILFYSMIKNYQDWIGVINSSSEPSKVRILKNSNWKSVKFFNALKIKLSGKNLRSQVTTLINQELNYIFTEKNTLLISIKIGKPFLQPLLLLIKLCEMKIKLACLEFWF